MQRTVVWISLFLLFAKTADIAWSQTDWTQTDWSNADYSSFESIDPDLTPGELFLKNDPSKMVPAFTPTQLEGVWNMEVYNGKLFIAACTNPVNIDGGEIISYDYASNTFQWEYDVWEQGVIQMRSHAGKLYVPGLDSQGSWLRGNIYIYDGSEWIRKETVPHGIHVFDLIFYKDEMYVTTGTDLEFRGIVYKSADDGDSWTEVFSVAPAEDDFRRLYFMGTYQDKLYVQSDLRPPEGKVLFSFDGNNWRESPVDSLKQRSYGVLQEFMGKLYFFAREFLYIYDGLDWTQVALPFTGGVISRGVGFYNGRIYGGAENGALYVSEDGSQWQLEAQLGSSAEEIEAIEAYSGRLYVGTNEVNGVGKVYVSAAASAGSLISAKHDFGTGIESGTLSWNALLPSQSTSVKFQLRTAVAASALDSALFIGPDASADSFYENSGAQLAASHSGHRWLQYKVYLATEDDALAPILQDVSIAVFLNSPPEVVNSIADGTLEVSGDSLTVALTDVFSDPDGDPLTFLAESTKPDVATAAISGNTVIVAPISKGIAEIIVMANDGKGGTASDTFLVAVEEKPNTPPRVVHSIADDTLEIGGDSLTVILTDVFSDPDDDPLVFMAESTKPDVATAAISGNTVIVAPISKGIAEIIVMANDGKGATAADTFSVVVEEKLNAPPEVVSSINDTTLEVSLSLTIDLLDVFNDPDGNQLTFIAESTDPTVAMADTSKNMLIVAALAVGDAEIIVIADDAKGGTAADTFRVVIIELPSTIGEPETLRPAEFRLAQNHPNPFNPATTIEFALPQASLVSLKIYDVLGKEIRTLTNRYYNAGHYTFDWDGKNNSRNRVSSGVYFYLLQAGDFSQVRKMTLVQ